MSPSIPQLQPRTATQPLPIGMEPFGTVLPYGITGGGPFGAAGSVPGPQATFKATEHG